MPDPKRLTISATEVAALFGESPWLTRWMLYHKFASGKPIDPQEDEHMEWGKRMQPLIIAKAAEELNLAVEPNESETYVRRGLLGCTRDAVIVDPSRGPGALETKCVFNWKVWQEKWGGGSVVPREYEIQLQVQMFVGDGNSPYDWGVIAAWCGAHTYYFERAPQLKLWEVLEPEAALFLREVAEQREPDPFGLPIELPLLAEIYPTAKGRTIDYREATGADAYVHKIRIGNKAKETATINTSVYESIRAEFIALMKDADRLLLPSGANVRLGKGRRISMWAPQESDNA